MKEFKIIEDKGTVIPTAMCKPIKRNTDEWHIKYKGETEDYLDLEITHVKRR